VRCAGARTLLTSNVCVLLTISTVSAYVAPVASTYGYALDFPGANAFVTVPTSCETVAGAVRNCTSIGGFTALTVAAWLFPTSVAGVRAVLSKDGSVGRQELTLALSTGRVLVNIGSPTGSFGLQWLATSTLVINTWTHVAVTWDGVTVTLYVEGVAVENTAYTGPVLFSNAQGPLIGAARSASDVIQSFFQGRMDDIFVYGNQRLKFEHIRATYEPILC